MNFYRETQETYPKKTNKFLQFVVKCFLPLSWQITRKILGGRWALIETKEYKQVTFNSGTSEIESNHNGNLFGLIWSRVSPVTCKWYYVDKNYPYQNPIPYKIDDWVTVIEFEDWEK